MAISSTVMAYLSHLHHRLHPRCILVKECKKDIVCKKNISICIYIYISICTHMYACVVYVCVCHHACPCVYLYGSLRTWYVHPSYACTKFDGTTTLKRPFVVGVTWFLFRFFCRVRLDLGIRGMWVWLQVAIYPSIEWENVCRHRDAKSSKKKSTPFWGHFGFMGSIFARLLIYIYI